MLELDDIQGTVLRYRPRPYFGGYLGDRRPTGRSRGAPPSRSPGGQRRDLVGSAAALLAGTELPGAPGDRAAARLARLVPRRIPEGMAARAELIGDVGDGVQTRLAGALGYVERPLDPGAVCPGHVDAGEPPRACDRQPAELLGISVVFRLRIEPLPTGRTHFGYTDGISDVTIESSGLPTLPGHGPPSRPEFVLGYEDRTGQLPPILLQRCWAAMAPTAFRSSISGWLSFAATCGRTAPLPTKRSCWRRRCSDAGAAARPGVGTGA